MHYFPNFRGKHLSIIMQPSNEKETFAVVLSRVFKKFSIVIFLKAKRFLLLTLQKSTAADSKVTS